jgi:hypothetical protein
MTISPNKWELDVQAYLNTCNITSATPRKQIRDFSAGVNDLGLWNSMVCWPLRSSQNYGSGTTAFSLGGLGTYNGVLTNGPSWGADGIEFTANDQILSAPLELPQAPMTWLGHTNFSSLTATATFVTSGSTDSRAYIGVRASTVLNGINAESGDVTNGATSTSFPSSGTTNGFVLFVQKSTTIQDAALSYNGASIVSPTFGSAAWPTQRTNPTDVVRVFNATPVRSGIFGWITGDRSSSAAALYSLYKSTLGTGLGLP